MKRRLVQAAAILVVLGCGSRLFAAAAAGAAPEQKTATGTIEKVFAKQHSIHVRPAAEQPAAAEAAAKKAKKPTVERTVVFYVDAKTTITSQGGKPAAPPDATAALQLESKFAQLKEGQQVRVTYQQEQVGSKKKAEEKPKDAAAEKAPAEKAAPAEAAKAGKGKKAAGSETEAKPQTHNRAIAIEILPAAAAAPAK
jgi:hypothetical protein